VRQALGLPFEGSTYGLRPMLADVRIADERDDLPQPRVWMGNGGYAFAIRLRRGLWRLVEVPRGEAGSEDIADEEVHERLEKLLGPGPADVEWASRFRIHVRSSPRFRAGRVLLAGDAAHVHSPAGAQGINGGIQDAHNLAWKLARAEGGADAERLLDSYDAERRAVVVETTSQRTDRLTRLLIAAPGPARRAAWAVVRGLLRVPFLRRRNLRRMTMIDLDYPGSPLLRRERGAGIRLPNPLLRAPDGGAVRLYELLPNAPVILEVWEEGAPAQELSLPAVIRIGRRGYEDPTGLLRGILGRRDGWILVRPDAHVAWARHRLSAVEDAVRYALG
jgi:hypothetical protein